MISVGDVFSRHSDHYTNIGEHFPGQRKRHDDTLRKTQIFFMKV